MKNCYLVLAFDQDCKDHIVLKEDSYENLSKWTSNLKDSNEIRKYYASKVNDAISKKQKKGIKDNGDIVIIRVLEDSRGIVNERIDVLYKKEINAFKNLIKIKNKNDNNYYNWLNFWDSLRFPNYHIIDNMTNEQKKKLIAIHYTFTNHLSEYNYQNWKPLSQTSYFKRDIFPNFKKQIKDSNYYYDIIRIIISAYKNYRDIMKLKGINLSTVEELSKVSKNKKLKKEQVEDYNSGIEENYEEPFFYDPLIRYQQHDDIGNTPLYINIKSYMLNGDVDTVKHLMDDVNINSSLLPHEREEIENWFEFTIQKVNKKR